MRMERIMELWLVAELGAYFLGKSLSWGEKFITNIRLLKIKRELKQDILKNIVSTYGNEVFYDAFDSFLQRERLVNRLLNNLYETGVAEYKALDYYKNLLVERFLQEHTDYLIYKSSLQHIVLVIFKSIFDALNECTDENARVIINNIKEIKGELEEKIEISAKSVKEELGHIKGLLERIENSLIKEEPSLNDEEIKTGLQLYRSTLKNYFWEKSKYVNRKLEDQQNKSVFDVLETYKRIVLLGEPGCGKTVETKLVLEEFCTRREYDELIPIYMSLTEYGVAYSSIRDGIKKRLEIHIPKINEALIGQLIAQGKIILILDGADEINTVENRCKFYFEINELLLLEGNYILVSSRRNQYHGNAKNVMEITLAPIDKMTVEQKLLKEGIHHKVTDELYDLFSTPLFLEIGVAVLKEKEGKFYNKSQLFEEYVNSLLYKRDIEKGIRKTVNTFEVMDVIGKISYEYFEKPVISYWEFDKILSGTEFTHCNISDIFRIDVFSMQDGIRFTHKQFKEYFAAFYLIKNLPIKDNLELYVDIMSKDEWQEVLVFVAGIVDNIEEQELFLNYLLRSNLKTYIRCVQQKNDLCTNNKFISHEEYTENFLKKLFDSYMAIVETYFLKLKKFFNPYLGKCPEKLVGKKACIVGQISLDKKHLFYLFDWKPEEEPTVQVITGDSSVVWKDVERRAIRERRNIASYGINLELSGLKGDTARLIAVDAIKKDLKKILENRNLYEDDFLLCEHLTYLKNKVKFIRDSASIEEMHRKVKEYVDSVYEKYREPNVELGGITHDNVDMIALSKLLSVLHSNNVIYEDNILPPSDIRVSGFIWNTYSREQLLKVIEIFFYQIVRSFNDMVELNFPLMKNYFHRSLDFPRKYKVKVTFSDGEGFESQPTLLYYYVSTSEDDLYPEISTVDVVGDIDDEELYDTERAFEEIIESFVYNGKEQKRATVTNSLIGACLSTTRKGFSNCPVGAYVYKQIENEFANIFGK